MILPSIAISRIAAATIKAELSRLLKDRISSAAPRSRAIWESSEPLDLDSLEAIAVYAVLCETFGLRKLADVQSAAVTIDDWVDRVVRSRPDEIVVRTSGSTGEPTIHSHHASDLLDEARWFADVLGHPARVVALVPPTHLYGAVWTAVVPALLGIPVVAAMVMSMPPSEPGDMIVAVPDQWAALARIHKNLPAGTIGISSGGPLAEPVKTSVLSTGIRQFFDIYGASETSAIGIRMLPEKGFELLPWWTIERRDGDALLIRQDGRTAVLPDNVLQLAPRRIELDGRRDHALQVGGTNVYPHRIEERLRSIEGVRDAAVRLSDGGRLKAFVVPAERGRENVLEASLRQRLADDFAVAERPTSIRFGPAIPRNAMGKLTDWS